MQLEKSLDHNAKTPIILDMIDVKFMQSVQDFLSQTLDVALVSVYKWVWLTEPSNNTDFCRKYTKRSKLGYNLCEECHQEWEAAAIKEGKPVIFNCAIGLTNFAVPVFVDGKYVACVIGGQVLTEQPDEKHFRKVAKKLGIDEAEYIAEMKNINILSAEKVKAVTDLLYLVTNSFASIAYAKKQLAKQGSDLLNNGALETWFLSNYGNVARPISTREYEVLRLIALGKSNTEIAKELFVSSHTIKAHVSSMLEKFGVRDRVQLAVKATKEGIV